ncbi:MAG: acetyl-CoA carboxylase carboxyl transferase subunit alpha, partial [Bacteroidia bacterium]
SCSSILWRSWDFKEKAAEALKLTAHDMLENGLIDGIVKEPLGGAHTDTKAMYEILKSELIGILHELKGTDPEIMVETRIKKFSAMGAYEEI